MPAASSSSHNAEAARAAALQAEFNEKKWVWVPDDRDGYLAGWVVKEEDDFGDVVMASGGEVSGFTLHRVPLTETRYVDSKVATLCTLQDEPAKV
jgi:hypothetical protein